MYFVVYQGDNKNYYWRLRAANHETIADGAEGYISKSNCVAGIKLVMGTSGSTPVYDQTVPKVNGNTPRITV